MDSTPWQLLVGAFIVIAIVAGVTAYPAIKEQVQQNEPATQSR